MNPMYRVKIPTPQPRYVFLSKLGGGLLWFWVLWRAKHDWNTLFVSSILCLYQMLLSL